MNLLFLGDIFGKPGRVALEEWLPDYRHEQKLHFVIANAENASGGKGVTRSIALEIFKLGVDVVTGGNHSFQHREIYDYMKQEKRLLRPQNMPPEAPGRGYGIFDKDGAKIAVINLQGRAFMNPIDCPFRCAQALIEQVRKQTPIIIIDFHAEATSEKMAMAAFLDGQVTAVIGTHTHIPTADARISSQGTAAITDVGMTGPYDSIIGTDADTILDRFITGLPVRHEVAHGPARICGVQIEINPRTGRALGIRQIIEPAWPQTGNRFRDEYA